MRALKALVTACFSTTSKRTAMTKHQPLHQQRPTLRGVVFDMDGTLTLPSLDLAEMYRRCGVDRSQDILKVIAELPDEKERQSKLQIIRDMEETAAQTLQLMPGAPEVLQWLQAHSVPTALVTRNTLRSVQVLQERFLHNHFDVIVARDSHAELPAKPDPAALQWIFQDCWKVDEPSSICMVGDSLENDVGFGQAAGTKTALLTSGRASSETKPTNIVPDITVKQLYNLPRQLWLQFEIESKLGTNVPLLKYDTPQPTNAATQAAAAGDLEALLLASKQLRHATDDTGNTPLIWAADAGHSHIVDHLLSDTSCTLDSNTINARGYLGATAVCRAARRGHTNILKRLIAAGANLDIPNKKLQYPLHFAAFRENRAAVELLLQSGVNTKVLDRKGRIPAEDTKNEAIRDYILAAMEG